MASAEVKIVNILFKLKINKMEKKESNSKKHFYISIVKSGFRLGACYCLFTNNLMGSAVLLAIAEVLGIIEEL